MKCKTVFHKKKGKRDSAGEKDFSLELKHGENVKA
jgi:hypothetical protein